MSEDMKAAWIAIAIMLPVLLGVGWAADIMARAVMGAMVISHGREVTPALMEPILPRVIWWLVAMWVFASGIVLLLARLGLNGMWHHEMPKPPPWKDERRS